MLHCTFDTCNMHKTHKDIIRLPPFQYLNQNTASSEAEMLQG